jgi:universal stress protein E
MQQFKNVLFVLEGSRGEAGALQHLAEEIASHGGKLSIIDVLPEAIVPVSAPGAVSGFLLLQKSIIKERQTALKALATKLRKVIPTLKVSTVVREGTDYIEIIRQVHKSKHDLVAKLSDNSGRLESMLFGTLDMNLLRKCPVPVLVLKGRKRIKAARVLAAVDLVRHDKSRDNLDRNVVALAASMARQHEGSMHLLHAWYLHFEKSLLGGELYSGHPTVDEMLQELRTTLKSHLQDLAGDYADLDPGQHLVKGKPQDVIPRFVKSHRIQLVVMGTVGRTGIAGLVIGNTAEKILQKLNCSVLAVKPEGFVSPIN